MVIKNKKNSIRATVITKMIMIIKIMVTGMIMIIMMMKIMTMLMKW